MTYFDDLVIYLNQVYDIDYRGKKTFVVDANVCSGEIMLLL